MNWYHFLEFESEFVKKIDFGEGVKDYSKAVLEHPQWAQAWMNRACSYMELGDKKNALSDADMAVELQKDAETLTMRGRIRTQLGLTLHALEDYNQAILINPEYHTAYLFRGRLRAGNKEYELAEQDFNKVKELVSNFPGIYLQCGWLYQEQGKLKEAEEEFHCNNIRKNKS